MTITFIKNIKMSLTNELDSTSTKSSKHSISHNNALELLAKSLEYINKKSINKLPEIIKNKYGKPAFKDQKLQFFNWSHTNDFVFLGMSKKKIGVDIEIERNRNIESIADRYFSIYEKEYIKKNPISNFFNIWVIREAISKYIGNGLQGFENITIKTEEKIALYKINIKDEDIDIYTKNNEKPIYIYVGILNENYHMAVVTEEDTIETFLYDEEKNEYIKTELKWTKWGTLRII